MKKSLAIFGAALMAFAVVFSQFANAGVPPTYPSGFPTVSISGTATVSQVLDPGWVYLRCEYPVHYKTGTASTVAAALTDTYVPSSLAQNSLATNEVPLNLTGAANYISIIADPQFAGQGGRCFIKRYMTDWYDQSLDSVDAGFNAVLASGGVALGSAGTLSTTNTKVRGTMTLNGASPSVATATVATGAICVCQNTGTAANNLAKCAVASTTLTATAPNGATDVVAYICLY